MRRCPACNTVTTKSDTCYFCKEDNFGPSVSCLPALPCLKKRGLPKQGGLAFGRDFVPEGDCHLASQSAMGRWAKKTKKGSSELPEASRSRGNSQKKSNLARLNPSASDAKPESGGEATTQEPQRQSNGNLPSEGIIAIYQQFRQIWRRQPHTRNRLAPEPFPSWSEHLKKAKIAAIEPCGCAAPAA